MESLALFPERLRNNAPRQRLFQSPNAPLKCKLNLPPLLGSYALKLIKRATGTLKLLWRLREKKEEHANGLCKEERGGVEDAEEDVDVSSGITEEERIETKTRNT
ncbi:hypothetical protein Pcinc_038505 [Petrolisthes cinctipes]|uniref:Uncharacterized protein n=1 Tax=Petrolisthes cinctipes TaxID=88211 RepID=A0AAE1BQP2_PETCI|nr:hypothetical protein Pcinc_038505 [Petrolisthes cinctipes]